MERSALLPHVYLVGFMGSGKSTIGPVLADLLQRPFYDLDDLIEEEEQLSIVEIFRSRGEEYFRQVETQVLQRAACRLPFVMALGGGTFVGEANRRLVQASGISVWLKVSVEAAWERCRMRADRPLASDLTVFSQLFQKREIFYQTAQLHIDTAAKNPVQISLEIRNQLQD